MLDFSLLIDLGMIVVFATIFNYLAHVFKQPALLGYMVAGLLIGPLGLGALGIDFMGVTLGITNMEEIAILSELGIALLLFSVGVETNFKKLLSLGKFAVVATVIQVVLTLAVVFAGSQLLGLLSFNESIYLGMIIAFSSTTIVVKYLSDSRQISTLHGQLMIGFLLVQDLIIVLALPLLENLGGSFALDAILPLIAKSVAIILFALLLNKFFFPVVFRQTSKSEELLYLSAVASCFIFIFVAYALNFSIAVGSFIAGLTLSTLPYSMEVFSKIRGLRDFFATIFFVLLGVQINLSFASVPLALIVFILAGVFVFKPIVIGILTLLGGYGSRLAVIVALGLAQISEFSFIIASQGYADGQGILAQTPGLYSAILLIIALSMVVTPYLMYYPLKFHRVLEFFSRRTILHKHPFLNRKLKNLENVPSKMANHIILVGGGTMGYSIAKALNQDNKLVLIDHDADIIFKARKDGINALYGTADNEEVFEQANIHKAKALVLAVPYTNDCLYLVDLARKANPKIAIFARAHHYSEALDLYEEGVDYVVMSFVIGSNILLQQITQFLETGKVRQSQHFQDEFMKYLEEKSEEEKEVY